MNWFKRLLGVRTHVDSAAVMDRALQIARNGHPVEALDEMQEAVEQVKESAGESSVPYAKALFNLATLHGVIGDMAAGANACVGAAHACPDTPAGKKDRLTYLMNAGQMLIRTGDIEQAISVLDTSLQEREAMYGAEHAGTAYGQQALAEAMMAAGRFPEGLQLSERALQTFLHEGHQETPSALAATTALASASGHSADEVWQYVPENAGGLIRPMIQASMLVAETMPGDSGMRYLGQLAHWAGDRLPPDASEVINVIITWSNLAAQKGDIQQRKESIDHAIDAARKLGDPAVIVNSIEGRALLLSEIAAPHDDVRNAYAEAYDEADRAGILADAAGVLRNWAIFESEVGRVEAAHETFAKSLAVAEQSEDREIIARTKIAFAIFQQHQNNYDAAAPMLREGIDELGPMHPDSACGLLHQVALEEKLDCPCNGGDMINEEALSQLATRFFVHSGLGDIVDSVGYGDSEDGERGLQVKLSRQPSESEMRRIGIADGVLRGLLQDSKS